MADEVQSDLVTAIGDAFFPFFDAFKDSPFAFFSFLSVLALVAIFLLSRNQPPWFRMASVLVIFIGLAALGYMVVPPRAAVTIQDSQETQPLLSTEAALETAPKAEQVVSSSSNTESEIAQEPAVQEAPFENYDGYLLRRPSRYSQDRSWFAYVGSFSDKDRAISHANSISRSHSLKTVVFLYGDRVFWGVALAAWTSEKKAKEAAEYASKAGIERTSYAASLPRDIFDTYPNLYDFYY